MISILITFAISFSASLLLSVTLAYRDVKPPRPDERNPNSSEDYLWERVIAVVFDILQAGSSICGIIVIVFLLRSRGQIYWLDIAVRCHLQLFAGTNFARNLRVFTYSHLAVWFAYAMTILTAPNVVYPIRDSSSKSAFDSRPLYLSTVASLLSSALARRNLKKSKNLRREQRILAYERLLTIIAIIYAAAALCQLCGAIVIDSMSLASSKINTNLRQGIHLACTVTHLLCSLTLCLAGIERRIIKPLKALVPRVRIIESFKALVRRVRATTSGDNSLEGVMRLNSL